MTIDADLLDLLTNSTSLAALSSDRTYPEQLPQNVIYPAMSYGLISEERFPMMGQDAENVSARYQIDCWDENALGARLLGSTVRQTLQRYESSTGTVEIETIFIDSRQGIPGTGCG